jgi:hypothetical protein
MAVQRLKQDNADSWPRANKDDLFFAAQTARFDGKKLRTVRMHVAQDGYYELAVYDIICEPRTFWHCSDFLPPERVAEVRTALEAARGALAGLKIDPEPNTCRTIECWLGNRRAQLKMAYTDGVPQYQVPAFEAAWALVVGLFPKIPY